MALIAAYFASEAEAPPFAAAKAVLYAAWNAASSYGVLSSQSWLDFEA